MTRTDLLTYLSDLYDEISSEWSNFNAATFYAAPLASTFRRLGVDESAEIATADQESAEALGEYYSLRRFLARVATRVDYPADKMMQARSQLFKQIQDLLKEAEGRCASLGVTVTGGTDYSMMTMALDYIEPEDSNG